MRTIFQQAAGARETISKVNSQQVVIPRMLSTDCDLRILDRSSVVPHLGFRRLRIRSR